jgi:WD40 repeat protein
MPRDGGGREMKRHCATTRAAAAAAATAARVRRPARLGRGAARGLDGRRNRTRGGARRGIARARGVAVRVSSVVFLAREREMMPPRASSSAGGRRRRAVRDGRDCGGGVEREARGASAEGAASARAPRALTRGGRAEGVARLARTSTSTSSAFGGGGVGGGSGKCSVMSDSHCDTSDVVSMDCGARAARAERTRRLKAVSEVVAVVVERGGARYASDTTLIDIDSGVDDQVIRVRSKEYSMKLETKETMRLRASEAWTQTQTPLMLNAHALTARVLSHDKTTQVDEFCSSDATLVVKPCPRLKVRTKVLTTIESALRERERAEHCLKYRALRPIEQTGALLLLETLESHKYACGLNVSSVKFNPCRKDMFAVAYGEFNFDAGNAGAHGALAVYSLRSREPLYAMRFDHGVMTIDWSTTSPTLLAMGCYDGEIAIMNLRDFVRDTAECPARVELERPIANDNYHTAPVWGIQWALAEHDDTIDTSDLKFAQALVSTSTDGKVKRWDLLCDKLQRGVDVLTVDWSPQPCDGKTNSISCDGALIHHEGVMCLEFSMDARYYVIGTQDGQIYKCSLAFTNEYLMTYAAHVGPIYCIKWSPFHPHVFATCSADWTVKIFVDAASEDNSFMTMSDTSSRMHCAPVQPVFVIEHSQHPINSLDWSPWCATEFAIVTDNGALEIWNLATSVAVPKIVVQVTNDHQPAATVSYARDAPVIIVGCANGSVSVFRITWPTDDDVHTGGEQRCRLDGCLKSTRVA